MTVRRDPRVEFDPHVVASLAGGRVDILLRGRAVSPSPVDEIALLLDDRPLARIAFATPDTDGSIRLPDAPTMRQYAVTFIVGRELTEPREQLALTTRITARGLPPRDENLVLRTEPPPPDQPGPTVVSIAEGRTSPLADHADLLAPIVLQVERAELDGAGQLTLSGWAVCLQPIVAVQVFAGGRLAGAATIGVAREHVEAAFPLYANAAHAGFVFSGRLEPDVECEEVLVQVIALNGISQEAAAPVHRATRPPAAPVAATPAPAQDVIRLHCDEASLGPDGGIVVCGWCFSDAALARIDVELDGVAVGEAEIGRPRADVGHAHGGSPQAALSGFMFRARADGVLRAGTMVGITAEDALGHRRRIARPLDTPHAAETPAAPAAERRIKYHLDQPLLDGDIARATVTGPLTVEGWVVAEPAVEAIDVMLDGERLGAAYYGLARQDVAAALPDWPGALRCGFAFHCPPRALKDGAHDMRLDIRLADGFIRQHVFRIAVAKAADADAMGGLRRRMPRAEADLSARTLARLGGTGHFVIVARGVAEAAGMRATFASLRAIVAADWSLHLDDGASRALLAAEFADLAPRLRGHAMLGTDDLVLPLAPGDELGADALAELALALAADPDADMAYGDELRGHEPFFKPDWSPELLLATDYIGRPWCARAGVLARAGLTLADMAALSNHDLLLRCTEQARAVSHVPALLCRAVAEEVAPAAQARAVQLAVDRRGLDAVAVPGRIAGTWRLRSVSPAPALVSVVIPTRGAGEHIRACIAALRAHTAGWAIEIVAVDNIPEEFAELKSWLAAEADVVVRIDEAFNWSRFNNRAAAASRGDHLLFLNDDVQATHDGWLDAMLELARLADVGAVGAQLLYPDGHVQHAGMFLAKLGQARHAFRFMDGDDPGPFGLALTQRNVACVTGACLLVRREVFDAIGGFDEAHDVINNDLDFCLRLGAAGKRVVYTPHASLIHHELASRAGIGEDFDTSAFEAAWRDRFVAGDPYHGPHLSKLHDDFRAEEEPVRIVHGGPLFARDDIRRILAVKVDHIGDFITALPALRQIKQLFPHARLSVLTGRAAQAFAPLEDSIDELIEFEFFHARSELGRKALDETDLDTLRSRLAPHRFDLAIDLRKHLDTRALLRATGATWLAGFDHLGQFPWLDIALEWEGDRGLHAKRYHVTDDLLHLVGAVATACQADRAGLRPERVAEAVAKLRLPARIERLFRAPVVCVHAGAGNPLKQWPPDYFATLVDLLLRRGLNVLFVGGPDEADVTADIIGRVAACEGGARADRIGSLVGRLKLADLPATIARCALYVGNDSGPKHIAAAVGVATVGIHSGTVDPREWAPLGPDAVAVHRAVSCSPCYIISADRCPRALACLSGIEPIAVMQVCERLLPRTSSWMGSKG